MKFTCLVLTLVSFAHAGFALAEAPVFIDSDAIDIATVIPPPPAAGSSADRADLDQVLALQNSRTRVDCNRAGAASNDVSLAALFGAPYGSLTANEVRQWTTFMNRVRNDVDYFVHLSKRHWGRRRPYYNEPRITPCVQRLTSLAYPSGHAAIGHIFARVLSRLNPSRSAEFQRRGDQVGSDRVLGGVHHPTDIQFGKELADRVFEVLVADPDFIREFNALPRR